MNKLPLKTRVMILNTLVAGNSLRSISRVTRTHQQKLMVDGGNATREFHNDNAHPIMDQRVECDEI